MRQASSYDGEGVRTAVLAALGTVKDPDLGQDLVTLGMIQDLSVGPEGEVAFRVVLTTPACPLKAKIEADVRAAVGAVAGVRSINVKMDAVVRGKSQAGPGPGAIPGVGHIIAVSSGKGGVGKSTVAVNLAVSLALEGAKVGLMDADVYGPNVPTMLGVHEQPKLVKHPQRGDLFVPPVGNGVKVMSMGFLIDPDQPLVWRGPMLHSVVTQFCQQVEWGGIDYLVVDMPPGTGDVQLSLAQLVPVTGAILVTTPQEVALQDVRRAFGMFEKVRIPILGVVENMSYFVCDGCSKRHPIFGSDGGVLLAKKQSTDLLGQIPLLADVRRGGDEGTPIVVRDPASPAAVAFRETARRVAQKISVLVAHGTGQAPDVKIGNFS